MRVDAAGEITVRFSGSLAGGRKSQSVSLTRAGRRVIRVEVTTLPAERCSSMSAAIDGGSKIGKEGVASRFCCAVAKTYVGRGGALVPKMKYWPLRYGVALAAVAAGIAFLLIPQIGKGLGSILFLAVLISAWYGGMGPGLLATALITVVAILGVVNFEPEFAPWRVASIVLFVGGGVLITLLVEALHAARRRVEAGHQELVRRMEQLAEADVRKDEFLAMLSHELRNPMAAIGSAVQLAALGGAARSDRVEHGRHQPSGQAPGAVNR